MGIYLIPQPHPSTRRTDERVSPGVSPTAACTSRRRTEVVGCATSSATIRLHSTSAAYRSNIDDSACLGFIGSNRLSECKITHSLILVTTYLCCNSVRSGYIGKDSESLAARSA